LFGLDLSRVGRYVRAGWHELLWGDAAGLRMRLDAPVELLQEDGTRRHFVAEHLLPDAAARADAGVPAYHALQFPSGKVLIRKLRLPKVLELELDEAIALEERTNSPFPADNTVYGWRLRARSNQFIELSLAIAAHSDVAAWMQERGQSARSDDSDNATSQVPEIWVFDDD